MVNKLIADFFGWGTRIRTWASWARTMRPTARLFPKAGESSSGLSSIFGIQLQNFLSNPRPILPPPPSQINSPNTTQPPPQTVTRAHLVASRPPPGPQRPLTTLARFFPRAQLRGRCQNRILEALVPLKSRDIPSVLHLLIYRVHEGLGNLFLERKEGNHGQATILRRHGA